MNDSWLQQAIIALKAGHKAEARRLLEEGVQANPRSERGWLQLVEMVNTDQERRFCLIRVLSINHLNASARRELDALGPGPILSPLLQRAAAALKAGLRTEARRLLAEVVHADPRSEQGWLWLSKAVDRDEERRFCLNQVLSLNCRNALAQRELDALGSGTVQSPLDGQEGTPETQIERQPSAGSQLAVDGRSILVVLGYLVALLVAEELTILTRPGIGLGVYGGLLVILILHSALTWEHSVHKLLLSLTFAPLIRILSLSLPLAGLPLIYWYVVTGVPLLVTAVLIARTLGFSRQEIGLNLGRVPIQILVGLTGLIFGYIEYQLLRPALLVQVVSWEQLLGPALILLICTGFTEEVIFRGVMQRATKETMGGLTELYVSALFAVLHVGHKVWLDVLFVFGVGLFFAWVVTKTRSLLGVTLAHGLTNTILFLVGPLLFGPGGG